MKTTIREQILTDCDDITMQIRNIKKAWHALFEASDAIRLALDEIELSLRVIRGKGFFNPDEKSLAIITNLEQRAERLRELRNIMELGSWSITIDRAMDDLYQKLP